jgi:hypothetical protein
MNYSFIMKTIKETIENYLIGTIKGAYKTKKHWMKKGFEKSSAIEKAWRYAIGQIEAGIGENINWNDAEEIYREIGAIANAFADLSKQVHESLSSNTLEK